MKLAYTAFAYVKYLTNFPERQVFIIVKDNYHLFIFGEFVDCLDYYLADFLPLYNNIRVKAGWRLNVVSYGHVVAVVP